MLSANAAQHAIIARKGLQGKPDTNTPAADPSLERDNNVIDSESRRGRFGWCEFEGSAHVPYIFRGSETFASVRMAEQKLLSKLIGKLPPEVSSCHRQCIRSHYVTEAESSLLNDINVWHTDSHFGKEPFTTKDLIVKLSDVKELRRFLELCHKKLVLKRSDASDRCGFLRINNASVVPYVVTNEGARRVVPLFYFEMDQLIRLKSETVAGWDLAYLKVCCKAQGARGELFAADECRVVALDEVKRHFPQGTVFEDYWPAKNNIQPASANKDLAAETTWTQQPSDATNVSSVPSVPSANIAKQSTRNSLCYLSRPAKNNIQPASANKDLAAETMWATAEATWTQQPSDATTVSSVPSASSANIAKPYYKIKTQCIRSAPAKTQQPSAATTVSSVPSFPSIFIAKQNEQCIRNAVVKTQQPSDTTTAFSVPSTPSASIAKQYYKQKAQCLLSAPAKTQQPDHTVSTFSKSYFRGKLKQIEEYDVVETTKLSPYWLLATRIEGRKNMHCINLVPHVFDVFGDRLMTLPDFVQNMCPGVPVERARHAIQDVLKIDLYKANRGQQAVLVREGKCKQFDPVPLIRVQDIVSHVTQLKQILSHPQQASYQGSKLLKLG